jgi:hypothetical protein
MVSGWRLEDELAIIKLDDMLDDDCSGFSCCGSEKELDSNELELENDDENSDTVSDEEDWNSEEDRFEME